MNVSLHTAQKMAEQREAEINRANAIRLAQAERGIVAPARTPWFGFAGRVSRRQRAALAG